MSLKIKNMIGSKEYYYEYQEWYKENIDKYETIYR